MRIKANGITFECVVEGRKGAPWLAFSNSLATNLTMWDPQAAALADAFRILRYDQRGHGGTDAPAGPYSFAQLIADVIALFDALDITQAHFVGLSMGGATALGLAEQHPGRVDRVVVCDSPCMSTPASTKQWEERSAAAAKGGMEAMVESTLARWFPPEVLAARPAHVERVRHMIRTTPVNGFIGGAAALADHNYNSAVGGVMRPVLFMAGEKDGVTPVVMKDMHRRLTGSRFVELAGAGHISNLDRSLEFNAALRDFLGAG
jgi:3-oxoadipate enol-lactonase